MFNGNGRPRTRIRIRREIAKRGKAGDVFLPDRLVVKLRRFRLFKKQRRHEHSQHPNESNGSTSSLCWHKQGGTVSNCEWRRDLDTITPYAIPFTIIRIFEPRICFREAFNRLTMRSFTNPVEWHSSSVVLGLGIQMPQIHHLSSCSRREIMLPNI